MFRVKNSHGGWVVYNTELKFDDGHTHVGCYADAMHLKREAEAGGVPRHEDLQFLESLARISKPKRRQEIVELLRVKRDKQDLSYVKRPKNFL